MRARMVLYHAGIQCELREIVLKNKPAAMLEISPKATVPVLQLTDGRVIDESLDIMDWALQAEDIWMHADRETMFDLINGNDVDFKMHLDGYKYPQRFVDSDDTEDVYSEQHFHASCEFLTLLEKRLEQSPFLFGEYVSMADVAIFPFVRQFAAVDRSRFELLPFEHLQRWLKRWLADTVFQQIMLKRKPWQPGDETVYLLNNDELFST